MLFLDLNKYADKIREISGAASKELSIEQVQFLSLVHNDKAFL